MVYIVLVEVGELVRLPYDLKVRILLVPPARVKNRTKSRNNYEGMQYLYFSPKMEPINCRALLEPLSCRSGKLLVQVTEPLPATSVLSGEGTGLEPAIRLLMFSHSHSSDSSS